ncbi:hypothetical protein J6590_052021 [Homalodisca vitripennis]|nr:hypothetical protein J6590_052021 [Homalodisca vitripennis]
MAVRKGSDNNPRGRPQKVHQASFKMLVDDVPSATSSVPAINITQDPEDNVQPDPTVSRPAPGLQNPRTLADGCTKAARNPVRGRLMAEVSASRPRDSASTSTAPTPPPPLTEGYQCNFSCNIPVMIP